MTAILSLVASKPNPKNTGTMAITVDTLSKHPDWRGVIALDEFSNRLVFRTPPPFDRDYAPTVYQPRHAINDADITRIAIWLDREYGKPVGTKLLWEAVHLVAHNCCYHAVREYLDSVSWDGVPRAEFWLERYCSVVPASDEHALLVRAVAKRWLIAAVARAQQPGCQMDTMLILEGPQGCGKSRGLEALAGGEFFCGTPLDMGSKDAFQNIQGVWIYELAELDSLTKAESSQAKAFISAAKDKFRAPYQRTPEEVPRSVVFCGTVNHGAYLKDLTGNRRYWTIRCDGKIDRDGIRAIRDQLWAEALHLYRAGEQWYLTPEEEEIMREEQADREPENPWTAAILKWVAALPPNKIPYDDSGAAARNDDDPFTLDQLWSGMQGYLVNANGQKYHAQTLGCLLEKLGYEGTRRTVGGSKLRCWVKKR
jgi:putative DNA primase/helicase